MRLAVVGSRTFNDYALFERELDKIDGVTEIVSGGAEGADGLAERYAYERRLELKVFHADWEKWGRSAGPRRNSLIVEAVDKVIAFWDGESRGTLDSISKAQHAGKLLHIVHF